MGARPSARPGVMGERSPPVCLSFGRFGIDRYRERSAAAPVPAPTLARPLAADLPRR